MKIRSDFVSNSSSSSFIVNKKEHGCWFSQLINIINNISTESIDSINIWFDKNIDTTALFNTLKESIQKYKCDDWFSIGASRKLLVDGSIYDSIDLTFPTSNLINLIKNRDEFMKHIVCIRVNLEYDLGSIEDAIYKQLENTGLKFRWIR